MKIKAIVLAVATLCVSQISLAQVKTLDFYSSSGSNRYSTMGKLKELGINPQGNSFLIQDANQDTYVKLNSAFPFHARMIENDLNFYQIIEQNKGKMVKFKDKSVKLVGAQNNNIIAESDGSLIFVPFTDIAIPTTFLADSQKGLKVSFEKTPSPEDVLYYSQPERNLRYANTYEAVLNGNNVDFSHYLNINNSSKETYDNVYLNFFLSETNIQENSLRGFALPMAAKAMVSNEMARDSMPPRFESEDIQNLKSIRIAKPMTIYPSLNKIKHTTKNYPVEQYAKLEIQKEYEVYSGDFTDKDLKLADTWNTPGSTLNKLYKQQVEVLRGMVDGSNFNLQNIIDVDVKKGDILPGGKLNLYSKEKGQEKLIVSSGISHVENENLLIVKNQNNDLKILNVELEDLKDNNKIVFNLQRHRKIVMNVKSVEIENKGKEAYTVKVLNKKVNINPGQKVKVTV